MEVEQEKKKKKEHTRCRLRPKTTQIRWKMEECEGDEAPLLDWDLAYMLSGWAGGQQA